MKVTKRLETEILKSYNAYWDSYFKGDMKTFATYLDDNCHIIGSTEFDIFKNKKSAVQFYSKTADQITGKADFKNRNITVMLSGENVMVEEFCDFYFLDNDEWKFYGHCRLSTLFNEKESGWKIIYQHGSMPDSKAQEGEQIAAKEIAEENKKLRDAIKRRTIELEDKNRELKIETALEKVRAIAMGMKEPKDMLEVCKTISEQLQSLGVKEIRNVQTAIFYESHGTYMNYEYYAKHRKTIITETSYTNNKIHKAFANKMLKGKDEFFTSHIKGKKVKEWLAYQKTTNVFIDKYLSTASSLNYYWDSLGPVALGISTYVPLNEEGLDLFKRFRNVFELAYTRYLDIEQALAQAREAKIEACLERVRSRSLAMHNTSELQAVIHRVHKELLNLDIAINGGSFIAINSDIETTLHCWGSGGTADTTEEINIPLYKKPFCTNLVTKIKKGPGFFTEEYTQKEKRDFFTFLFKHEPWKKLTAKQKKETLLSPGGYTRSCYVSKHTSIFIINHFGENFSAADNDILQRFGKVFEQSYTRFLDLQKAEAQTREAKIEAAVERVRAEAMAMHSTSDFEIVVKQLLQQIQHLNLEGFTGAQIILIDEKEFLTVWDCSSPGNMGDPKSATIRYEAKKFPIMGMGILNKWKEGQPYFVMDFDLKKLRAGVKEWKKINVTIAGLLDSAISGGHLTHQWDACGRLHNGMIAFDMIKPPDDDVRSITIKMTQAFEQAYIRFLDLQKAEAQSREAQIELALERVRARTMAMQHSDELADASFVLDSQVRALGIQTRGCAFNIYEENESTEWFSSEMGAMHAYKTPRKSLFLRYYEAGKKGESIHIEKFEGDVCAAHYKYLCSLPGIGDGLNAMVKAGGTLPTHQVDHVVYFKYGYLLFITADEVPEAHDIFVRFAKVFEQTYTRFLDLQKAEAQSRESQIQLALERLRARTMAMQHSNELLDAATLLFQQIKSLGTSAWNCSFNIWTEDKKQAIAWNATKEGFGRPFNSPSNQDVFQSFYEASLKGEEFYVEAISGDALKHHYDYLSTLPGVGETLAELKAAGVALPTFQIFNIAYFTQGYLMFITYEPVPELWDIFKRFAKVFEQTYTRFLDLQKAEAQAREAQIEAALEKVRSRSMGMQKSDELKEVIQVVYDQFVHLNINTEHAGFVIDYKLRDDRLIWVASKYGLPSQLTIPYFDSVYYNSFNEAKEKELDFFATNLDFEEKNNFYRQLFAFIPGLSEEDREFYFNCPGLAISTVLLENIGLYIENFEGTPYSDDENKTLMRFGKVFQQTYTRFLDLQRAEEQAREAQVEAALEKVRSRSLAMHKSDEIGEIVWTVVEKMKELKVELNGISLVTYIPHSKDTLHWHVNPDLPGNSSTMLLPYFDDLILKDCNDAKEKGIELLAKVYTKEQKDSYFNKAIEVSDFKYFPEELKKWALEQPCLSFSFAIQKHSGIFLEDYNGKIFSEKENDILIRFSRVFEQSYTRFLDLQKAEEQAREAQIEAALERTRTQSMIMQHSNELNDTLRVFHEQVLKLNIPSAFSFLWLPDEEKNKHLFWAIWEENKKDSNAFKDKAINYPLDRNEPATAQCLIDWKSNEPVYSYPVPPKDVENYFATWHELIDGVEKLKPEFFPGGLYYVEAFMKYGCFGVMVENDLSEVEKKILYRFAVEFERTYTRFLDLQKAEAQSREAQIETALEKVRSRTLAMQKSDELAETAAEVFKQLIALGIEPNRLYIGIIKDQSGDMEMWATDEDGTEVGKKFMFNKNENVSVKKLYDGWATKEKSVIVDMEGKELEDYFHYLNEVMHIPFKGGLTQKRRVQSVAYFSKGFIGMASPDGQGTDTLQLLERFAAVFNLTFTRFNDLKIAEAHAQQAERDLIAIKEAKQKAEIALTELQAAQKQLVQSEKMASLGELTAGIAHEIQNPLNFVNNFSEVSKELLDEMKDALEKGDKEEAKEIMQDVIQNLEKINHHGKRADGIVKGMLQHSRSTSATKEPTDINALADEYIRLCYHGLRAKDKTFNATIKTDFDITIEKINIIPQDIGRVVLNLLTNAFYAVDEKKKSGAADYEPTVSISTKKFGDKVEIKVADNGNGISPKILEKIFQPFFTTKPTGQGTGLGLSLSYDIIKAHGGELKVETMDGEGSAFTILLPENI